MSTIMWRRLHGPGLDRATIAPDAIGHRLAGTALFSHDGASYDIRYSVLTDPGWRTTVVAAHLQGPDGERRLALRVDEDGHWTMGDEHLTELAGALDVDFQFTPATNTLPIRRLGLEVGARAEVTVAHVAFPERSIELRRQTYERTGEDLYRFTSGEFSADITVDADGLVTSYPGLWKTV